MKTIWKYPIRTSCHEIEMPLNAEILCVQLQNHIPTLWALVETEEPKRIFDILTYYTGDDTGDDLIDKKGRYIGTYQLAGLVHHVFVRPHPASPQIDQEHLTFATPKSGFMSSYFESLARNQF